MFRELLALSDPEMFPPFRNRDRETREFNVPSLKSHPQKSARTMESQPENSRVSPASTVTAFRTDRKPAGHLSPDALPVVRLVYLVPKDRVFSDKYATAITDAASQLAVWFKNAVGNGKTFQPTSVESHVTPNIREWYAEETDGRTYWSNVLHDGFPLTGGTFNDPYNIWLYYIDAVDKNGGGGGGTSGVAVLTGEDLEGLIGMHGKISRWVGGLGHELGHALGRPHPAVCNGSREPDPPCNSLMYLGYTEYPATYLTPEDKAALAASPFFNT